MMAFLAHGAKTPEYLGAVIEAEPHFALAHAAKGMFYLLLGRRELYSVAEEALQNAHEAVLNHDTTAREKAYVEALAELLANNPTRAIAHLEGILAEAPEDALAMKLSHAIRFVLGDSEGMRRSIERVLPAYGADHPARGYLLGCHAFSLEETGDYAKAEVAGRQGIIISKDDAWGLHAVAHVFDMTADSKAGLKWLSGRESAWEHCNNFRYHVWWHKALMHLDLGEIDAVMQLYDAEIRKEKTDDYRDISNATSLLSRLELEGIDVGDRWEELAVLSENRTEDGCLIFADLHYMLALLGGKREEAIAQLMGRMQRDARASQNEAQRRMAAPGLSAAAGLHAFGEGDYEAAFLNLSRARSKMQNAGGSHAQRDVFERLTIDAGIRSGYLDDALSILNDRIRRRDGKEDNYASVRKALIASGKGASVHLQSLPAQ